MRFANFAAAVEAFDVARGDGLARVRADARDARVESRWAAAKCVKRKSGSDVGGVDGNFRLSQGQREKRKHGLRAVEQREAFFRFQHQGRDSCGAHGFVAGENFPVVRCVALAHRHLCKMRERREVARRAHRTLRRNHGRHATIEHGHQCFRHGRPHAGKSLGQRVGSQCEQRARDRLAQWCAHSARVAAHQIDLQVADLFERNAHRGQFPRSRY